ncbi:hypothetical protein [Helicobacter sp. T3_23-1056]
MLGGLKIPSLARVATPFKPYLSTEGVLLGLTPSNPLDGGGFLLSLLDFTTLSKVAKLWQ